jgi:hypothetical protein
MAYVRSIVLGRLVVVGGDLHTAVGGLLDIDVHALTDAELHELLLDLAHQQDRLAVAVARVATAWNDRMVWADDGSRSGAMRLARETGRSTSGCRSLLRDAGALDAMPVVADAVVAGDLTFDTVPVFSAARGQGRDLLFAEREDALVEVCARHRHSEIVRLVRRWTLLADAELDPDRDPPLEADHGYLHASSTFDGVVVIDGQLDAIGGSIVTDELHRLIQQLQEGVDDPHDIPVSQWRARALVEMATRSASTPAGSRRPRPLFTVLVGDDTARDLCELANRVLLDTRTLAPYLRDAMIESVLFDGPTRLIGVSQQRSFTGALRRGIEVRDRVCQHEHDCDTPANRADIDHIIPWSDGGQTSQGNGRVLCAPENRNPLKRGSPQPLDTGPPPTATDIELARQRWRLEHNLEHPLPPDITRRRIPDKPNDGRSSMATMLDRGLTIYELVLAPKPR